MFHQRVFHLTVVRWEKVPTERAAGVFGKGQDHRTNGEAALISRWRRHVCQLEVGLEFLAKRSRP